MEQTLDAPTHSSNQDIYAGFWLRVVANIIDSFIVGAALSVVLVPFGIALGLNEESLNNMSDETAVVAAFGMFGLIFLLGTVGVWLYFGLMESGKHQATLGKMALGIKVTDTKGAPITFWRAIGRNVAKILSSIMYIGYIMVAFTDKKQGLHDMIAECLVVKKDVQMESI
ncbi:MAG: RDD family protein [Cyclobacteriaceae bacterium]